MNGTLQLRGQQVSIESYPDECPVCHRHSQISQIGEGVRDSNSNAVQAAFQCGFNGCKSYFVGYFLPAVGGLRLTQVKPQTVETSSIPETVQKLSPTFVDVYREAETAKSHGLNQIAGPGYRKAFEFLIKDYAISKNPDDKERIENSFSGNVVKEFIEDIRIQKVAKRVLWLGNDESHYLKKWVNHNTEDLIILIRLAIGWIEIEQLSNTYEADMPD